MKKLLTTVLAMCVALGVFQAAAQTQPEATKQTRTDRQQSPDPQRMEAPLRLLVGTYTENTTAQGVYLFSFGPETADTQLLDMAPAGNPSFVVASPDGTRAYAVNEFNDGRQGVSAFSLSADSIELINTIPIPQDEVSGEDPCNILLIPATRHITGEGQETGRGLTAHITGTGKAATPAEAKYDILITSNYTGGSVTAFAADTHEGLLACTQWYSTGIEYTHALLGTSLGNDPAHMHCAVLSPDGKYIFVTNLGNDCIHRFERRDGIHPLGNATTAWQHRGLRKYGPRHLIFSADGRFAYLICELTDHLVVFSYNDGELTPIQTLKAYDGRGCGSADIHLSPDGRFLYTSHRLKEDGIAIFGVDPASGNVTRTGFQPTGTHPRNFAISPDGRYLLCACRDSNAIEIYSIDKNSGALSPSGKAIEVGAPVCVQFVD